MIHLSLPPFDYESSAPYVVSSEDINLPHITWHRVADTLEVAILLFWQRETEDHGHESLRRLVDARGVTILGVDEESPVDCPSTLATDEVLRRLRMMMPKISESTETFEMTVREQYVHLRGGT